MDTKEFDWALGQLRHLYKQMSQGIVVNSLQAASGLLGPAIEKLETYRSINLRDATEIREALKPEIEALYRGIDRLAQAQQIVVSSLDNATMILRRIDPKE